MKRTIAFLMTLVLVCGMAFAVHADRSAADVLVMGGDITLTEDLTLPANIQSVQLNRETNLDLNGYTITSAGSKVQLVVHNEVSITNGTLRKVEISVEADGTLKELSGAALEYCAVYAHDGHIGTIRKVSMTGGSADGVSWGQVRSFGKGSIDHIADSSFAQCSIGCTGTIGSIQGCYVYSDSWALYVEEQGTVEKISDCVLEARDYCGIDDRGTIGTIDNTTIIGGGAVAYNTAILFRSDKPVLPRCTGCYFISPRYAGSYEEWDPETLSVKSYGEFLLSHTKSCKLLKTGAALSLDTYRDTPNKLGLTVPVAAPVPETIPEPEATGSLTNFKSFYTYRQGQFTDVEEDYWGAANIQRAYEIGLLKGASESSFAPEGPVTLAQAVTMASRLNSIYLTGAETFTQGDVWYQVYVDYAREQGILGDAADLDFDGEATRAQFAALLAAALPAEALEEINQVSDDVIPDVKMDDEDAEAIYRLYRAGILTGNDAEGTFAPDSTITRAAAAAILTRMADTGMRRTVELG